MAYVEALLRGDYDEAIDRLTHSALARSPEALVSQLLHTDIPIAAVALVLGRTPSLCGSIVKNFPKSPAEYLRSTYAELVPMLARYFHFELHVLEDGVLADVQLATNVRQAFDILVNAKIPGAGADPNSDDEEGLEYPVAKVKGTFKRIKKRKETQTQVSFETKPFHDLGHSPPRSREDADRVGKAMLEEVKTLLSYHLGFLQLPATTMTIEEILQERLSTSEKQASGKGSERVPPSSISSVVASATPPIADLSDGQELRAMIEFDVPEEMGEWHVFMSTQAYKDIRNAHRGDKNRYRIIVKKIQQLSMGHFSGDNQKRLTRTSTKVPIYEAKMTGDSRLIYQVDCVADPKLPGLERQVIKLYGVYTHAQMDDRLGRVFDAVGREVGKKGREYQQRCVYRLPPAAKGDKVFAPATFPLTEEKSQNESEEIHLAAEDMERVHELLTLEKYFLFSQNILNCIVADLDVAHVFHLSQKELEIVGHVGPCYVLGRSGTGKTTTMLFKMLGLERSQRLNAQVITRRPRQLFVTQSHVLVEKVEEAYNKLAKSLDIENCTKEELKALAKNRTDTTRDHLVKNDDKKDQGKTLPQRFSELTDDHFPMFVTYDRLCRLIEGDDADRASEDAVADADGGTGSLTSRVMRRNGRLVTYELFLTAYWPHFSQKLIKGLDASLVFSEIMGVIKGSKEASALPSRYLDREAYEGLSTRRQSTFANRRTVVYDVFMQYMKEKAARDDYDAADRTHNILRILQDYGLKGSKIDYLYVDEVQDNLLIDALVLRYITSNPNGLFWAGDTAQTISVGSAFRFNDLKDYLHSLERKQSYTIQRKEPRSFQLTTNYRSHGGIVDCAHSIICLIMEYWPDSIDTLVRERGEVAGPKPVFLTGRSDGTMRYEQFVFTSSSTGNAIEFGAKQCILVRHEEARQNLREEFGDEIGLIMTLYESKGLEFDDVMLFNFFQDSSVETSQWRVVLNALDPGCGLQVPAPRFDENLHAGVCSELKFLYVAITRGRKNVWIVDASDRGEPMRMLLTSRDHVQNLSPDDVPRLAVSSTQEEWREAALEFFKSEKYIQAKMCYQRAGLSTEAAIAQAHHLRQQAALKPSVGFKNALIERYQAFVEAAKAFVECAAIAQRNGQTERQEAYYRAAAKAYVEADDQSEAAKAFINAGDFAEGAKLYRDLGNFDEVMNTVQTYRPQIDETLAEKWTNVSRLHYFQVKDFEKATNLFDTIDDALEFLEETPFDVEKASLLESVGNLYEAAKLYLDDRPLHAVHLFLKDVDNSESVEQGWRCVLDGLWKELAFEARVDIAKAKPLVAAYFRQSAVFIEQEPTSPRTAEFRMFHAIVERKSLALQSLARYFLINGNPSAAFRSMQSIFSPQLPNIRELQEDELTEVMSLYRNYVRLLHDLAFDPAPCDKPSVRRIFGLQRAENGRACFVPRDTFLYEKVSNFAPAGAQFTDDGVTVTTQPLTLLLSVLLQNRLHTSLMDENYRCQHASALRTVCLTYTLRGSCHSYRCTRIHPEPSALDAGWYNRQVHLHLLQISILDYDIKELGDDDRSRYQRFWINKLYETLYPATVKLGTAISLSNALIPDAPKYFQIVKYWCQDLLRSNGSPQILTTILRVAHLSFTFDRSDAPRYLSNAPALEHLQKNGAKEYFRNGQSIISQLLVALEGQGTHFIEAGVSVFRQIIDARLPIDISALCHFCEYLTGCFVVGRARSGFHDLTLPKGWIIGLVGPFKNPKFQPITKTLPAFVEGLAIMLDVLYNGLERTRHLRFEGAEISESNVIRGVFMARICRMLCAVGYNSSKWFDERKVREDVTGRIMKIFERPHAKNQVIEPYLRARHWSDLRGAYQDSAKDQLMDEVVTLKLQKTPAPVIQVPGFPRQVVFKTVSAIPTLLGHQFFVASALHAAAGVFIPASQKTPMQGQASVAASVTVPGRDATGHQAPPSVEDAVVASELQDTEPARSPPTAVQKVIAYRLICMHRRRARRWEASRTHAACVLQAGYRRLVAFRSLSGLGRTRQDMFATCVAESRHKIAWPSRRSRILYFGALPHILTALDVVTTYLESVKGKVKQEFAQLVDHQELDAISDKLTDVNTALRQVKLSMAALRPQKATYSGADCVVLLKQHTAKLVALAERLTPGGRLAIEYDLEMAVASVLEYEERKRNKLEAELKKEKPVLNTYDDEYEEY